MFYNEFVVTLITTFMPPTLKASTKGIAKIKQARIEKGWTTKDPEACRQASKIIEPDKDWSAEEIKLGNIFADGAGIDTWKRFLQGTAINTKAFKAFCQILELDYLEICRSDLATINIYLRGNFLETNKEQITSKLEEVERLLDGEKILFLKIEEGSIILKLKSSIEGYEKLQELARSGQLEEILGFPVENIELESIEPTDTREWLESLFNLDWQPAERLLATSNIRSSATDAEPSDTSVAKAKIIDLGERQNVVVCVQFTSISDEEIKAKLEVYPDEHDTYLREGLVIEILDEADAIALHEEVESYADLVQLQFSFEPQEQFKIKFVLENISVIENLFSN